MRMGAGAGAGGSVTGEGYGLMACHPDRPAICEICVLGGCDCGLPPQLHRMKMAGSLLMSQRCTCSRRFSTTFSVSHPVESK